MPSDSPELLAEKKERQEFYDAYQEENDRVMAKWLNIFLSRLFDRHEKRKMEGNNSKIYG